MLHDFGSLLDLSLLSHLMCAPGEAVHLLGGEAALGELHTGQLGEHVAVVRVGEVQLIDVAGLDVLSQNQALHDGGLLLRLLHAVLALLRHEAHVQSRRGIQYVGFRVCGPHVFGVGDGLLDLRCCSSGHSFIVLGRTGLVNKVSHGLLQLPLGGGLDDLVGRGGGNLGGAAHDSRDFAALGSCGTNLSSVFLGLLVAAQGAETRAETDAHGATGQIEHAGVLASLVGNGDGFLSAFFHHLTCDVQAIPGQRLQHLLDCALSGLTGNSLHARLGRGADKFADTQCGDVKASIRHFDQGRNECLVGRSLPSLLFGHTQRQQFTERGAAHRVERVFTGTRDDARFQASARTDNGDDGTDGGASDAAEDLTSRLVNKLRQITRQRLTDPRCGSVVVERCGVPGLEVLQLGVNGFGSLTVFGGGVLQVGVPREGAILTQASLRVAGSKLTREIVFVGLACLQLSVDLVQSGQGFLIHAAGLKDSGVQLIAFGQKSVAVGGLHSGDTELDGFICGVLVGSLLVGRLELNQSPVGVIPIPGPILKGGAAAIGRSDRGCGCLSEGSGFPLVGPIVKSHSLPPYRLSRYNTWSFR